MCLWSLTVSSWHQQRYFFQHVLHRLISPEEKRDFVVHTRYGPGSHGIKKWKLTFYTVTSSVISVCGSLFSTLSFIWWVLFISKAFQNIFMIDVPCLPCLLTQGITPRSTLLEPLCEPSTAKLSCLDSCSLSTKLGYESVTWKKNNNILSYCVASLSTVFIINRDKLFMTISFAHLFDIKSIIQTFLFQHVYSAEDVFWAWPSTPIIFYQ